MVSKQLEKVLQSIIKLRHGSLKERELYIDSFKHEDIFINIGEEFIPFTLLKDQPESKRLLADLISASGKNEILQNKDRLLSAFYRDHHLKRDIYTIADSISYYVIPSDNKQPTQKPIDNHFIDVGKIIKLSQYADQEYNANNKSLKAIGSEISKNVLMPVNFWLDTLTFPSLAEEPERYWQVAGTFKPFLWGKLYNHEHHDKKVFFCVGIDLRHKTVFYGLDCLRSGSNKLTAEQLLKFDHYTAGETLRHEIPLKEVGSYNWDKLNELASTFIEKHQSLYKELVAYIWGNQVDISSIRNKLLKVKFDKNQFSKEQYEGNDKLTKSGLQFVLDYEIDTLLLRNKVELAKQVKLMKNKGEAATYDIRSYNLDGSLKLIKVITSKSFSIDGFKLSSAMIDKSAEAPERSYLYIVLGCSKKRKSGLLMVRKGSFESALSLEPTEFKIGIN